MVWRTFLTIASVVGTLSTGYAPPVIAGVDSQRLAALTEATTTAIYQALSQQYPHADIAVRPLPLNAAVEERFFNTCKSFTVSVSGHATPTRGSVKVQCTTPDWSFYTSVINKVTVSAVVAKQVINRNEALSTFNLARESVVLGHHTDLVHDLSAITGKVSNRRIRAGDPLRNTWIKSLPTVQRGDHVQIVAQRGLATITAPGIAQQSGQLGEQIQVQNANSKQSIRVWIWGRGQVGLRPLPATAQNL